MCGCGARPIAAALLVVTLLATPAIGQTPTADARLGPDLVVLSHHPFPDAADPLGFEHPAGSGQGFYAPAFRHLDDEADGFDFPHVNFDGVLPVEGLPDGESTFDATLAAYRAGFDARRAEATPLMLTVTAVPHEGLFRALIEVEGAATVADEPLRLWAAVVEDHVQYDGGRLGNGITDHRFVVRELRLLGAATDGTHAVTFGAVDQVEQASVAAWVVTAPAGGLRFDPHEVVQAVAGPLDGVPTTRTAKAVLMQVFSATWCDPCLIGDLAAEALAAEFGAPDRGAPKPTAGYFRAPPGVAVLGAVAAALVVYFLPRRSP